MKARVPTLGRTGAEPRWLRRRARELVPAAGHSRPTMLAPQGPHDLHAPISRTQRYKKITKPLLERQRRARINRCLDELKELVVSALQTEGENVSKLEKADILELTVRHLHRLQQESNGPQEDCKGPQGRFEAGFSQCASEACHFLLSLPGLDPQVSRRIVDHLGQCADGLQRPTPPPQQPMWRPW